MSNATALYVRVSYRDQTYVSQLFTHPALRFLTVVYKNGQQTDSDHPVGHLCQEPVARDTG
jgi:hypothetical protein